MMKSKIRFRSLSWQINIILVTGTGVVAITAMLLVSTFLVNEMKDGLKQKASALATLLSANLGAAVEFDDKDAAVETMVGLKQDSEFKYCVVLKKDGTIFADLGDMPKQTDLRRAKGHSFALFEQNELIHVTQPIVRGKELIGRLQLGFSLTNILKESSKVRITGIFICAVLIVALTLYFAYAMSRAVVRPISQMTRFVQKLGEGDLREYRFPTRKEKEALEISLMRDALESTTRSFRENVQSIQTASNEFAAIANHILDSSSQLATTASQQVEKVVDAVNSARTMESAGEETAGSAKEISNEAETSVEVSGEGLSVVSQSFDQFQTVRTKVQTIADAAKELNALISQIDNIVISVANVARQSQLLAVNASVEAAKAGEAGLRFAVVARQVKDLALQSKDATNTVRQTLGNVKNRIKNIAEVSEEGRQRTILGLTSIEGGGRVIERLAEVINSTAKAAIKISGNTDTQVTDLREMSTAMFTIDELSKTNLAEVREIKEYGESLNSKAHDMEQLVSKFRIE